MPGRSPPREPVCPTSGRSIAAWDGERIDELILQCEALQRFVLSYAMDTEYVGEVYRHRVVPPLVSYMHFVSALNAQEITAMKVYQRMAFILSLPQLDLVSLWPGPIKKTMASDVLPHIHLFHPPRPFIVLAHWRLRVRFSNLSCFAHGFCRCFFQFGMY